MSDQTPSATQSKPLIREDTANVATSARKDLIQIAAFDLHRAARSYKPRNTGYRAHRSGFENRVLPWYIPPFAVLQTLR
jgi:hypothetical protein